MKPHPLYRHERRGFALLAVLWVIVGISALGLAASVAGQDAIAAARNRTDLTRAAWRAEGCVERARAVIDAALSRQAGSPAGDPTGWSALDRIVAASPWIRAADCDVSLRAAGTTLNVNTATGEQLHALFRALGLAVATADSLTDAVLDWRDSDDIARPHGAERSWYEAAGRFPPRNGALGDPRELRWIRGLEAVPAIESVLGVEPGRICLRHAPPAVLAALPGVGAEAVLRIVDARRRRGGLTELAEVAGRLSPRAKAMLLARYSEVAQATTTQPDAWIVTGRARVGSPPATAVVELRLVRAGSRAAIVRRRTWAE